MCSRPGRDVLRVDLARRDERLLLVGDVHFPQLLRSPLLGGSMSGVRVGSNVPPGTDLFGPAVAARHPDRRPNGWAPRSGKDQQPFDRFTSSALAH
jgi:hypothetical protein